jgi:hypothetical protein
MLAHPPLLHACTVYVVGVVIKRSGFPLISPVVESKPIPIPSSKAGLMVNVTVASPAYDEPARDAFSE